MVSEVHPMQQALNALPRGAIWTPGKRDYPPMDLNTFRAREVIKDRFSWAIPNEEALDAIAAVGPIVEIGAGTGYWAWLLQKRGVDVVAYDAAPPHFGCVNHWHRTSESTFTDVLTGGPQEVVPHADRTLMLCWPPYDDPMAERALTLYLAAGGKRLVYIGESWGGCTGDNAFHTLLRDRMAGERMVDIPQWYGVHDYLAIYGVR